MKRNIRKLLNKKRKPIVKHKYSKEEYKEKRDIIKNKLDNLEEIFKPHINTLKLRITKMNLDNIEKVTKYYFNVKNHRSLSHLDDLFIQSYKEIEDLLKHLLGKVKEVEEISGLVHKELNFIKKEFLEQHKYINEIEKEYHELKKSQQHNF